MKFLLLILTSGLTAGPLSAQSNPSWWKYVPPESDSVVGMQWKELQASLLGPVLAGDFAPGGSFGFPDIAVLRTPEQILLSSPVKLAIEYGVFPIEKLRVQAEAKGLKRVAFRPAEMFVSSEPGVQSVAYINERLVLVGSKKVLEDTILRLASSRDRSYSPLLARAARYSKEDLWVVAARLPDPLASKFLPLEMDATAFEGSVSLWDGLHLVAAVEKSSPTKALDFADDLAESLADRPSLSEATQISTRDRSVLIRMELDEMELLSNLKIPATPVGPSEPHEMVAVALPVAPPVAAPAPSKPQPKAFAAPVPAKVAPKPAAPVTVAAETGEMSISVPATFGTPMAVLPPAPPKTIKIMGLDSGPKEIPLSR